MATGVYAVAVDKRAGRPWLLAGTTSSHFGPSVATSDDLGASGQERAAPPGCRSPPSAPCGRSWTSWMPPGPAGPPDPRRGGDLRRYVNVYVDGEDCRHVGGLDGPLPDGAKVQVLSSVAGG